MIQRIRQRRAKALRFLFAPEKSAAMLPNTVGAGDAGARTKLVYETRGRTFRRQSRRNSAGRAPRRRAVRHVVRPPELRMQTSSFFRIPPLLPRLASFGRLPQAAPKEAAFYTPPGGIYGFSVPIVAFFGAIDCFSGIRCFFVRTALHYYWLTHIIGLYIGYSIVSTD